MTHPLQHEVYPTIPVWDKTGRSCHCGNGNKFPQNWIDIIMQGLRNPTGNWKDFNNAVHSYVQFSKISGYCYLQRLSDLGNFPNPANYENID